MSVPENHVGKFVLTMQIVATIGIILAIALMAKGFKDRSNYQSQQQGVLRALTLQLAISNSLVSDDTLRVRIAEYLFNNSHNKLTPNQCVDVAKAVMDGKNLWKIPPALTLAVMYRESNYDPNAISPTGAIGLLQVLPSTARPYLRGIGWTGVSVKAALEDPYTNTRVGLSFLSDLIKSFHDSGISDVSIPLTAYNFGEGAVRAYLAKKRFDVTKVYANNILQTEKQILDRHFR